MSDLGAIIFHQPFDPQKLLFVRRSKDVVEDNEKRLEGRMLWDNESEPLGVWVPIGKISYALRVPTRVEATQVTTEETVVVLAGHIVVADGRKDRTIKPGLRDLQMEIFVLLRSYSVGQIATDDDKFYIVLLHLRQKMREDFVALSQVSQYGELPVGCGFSGFLSRYGNARNIERGIGQDGQSSTVSAQQPSPKMGRSQDSHRNPKSQD